jgi:predicted metal-dependent peptidase
MALTAEEAIKKCRNAIMVLGVEHPHFLVIHARIREMYQVVKDGSDGPTNTMGITSSGRIIISASFVEKLDSRQLAGVLCHEMMHLMLMHHSRMGARDPKLWNKAADICINEALRESRIELPPWAYYRPPEYTGELVVEQLYEWLLQNDKSGGGDGGEDGQDSVILPSRGCAVISDGVNGYVNEDGEQVDWRLVAAEFAAAAKQAGRGSAALARLIEAPPSKTDWRRVIRRGVSLAAARPGRDMQTLSKRSRRSPPTGFQFPGWKGLAPKVCVLADISGSMDQKWVNQLLGECQALMKQFEGLSIYFISHTSEVMWEGWVTPLSTAKLVDAVQFTGGTDPAPAYAAASKIGKFDAIIHFTDTVFTANEWPAFNARQLIVGLFNTEPSCKPPQGSIIIPCYTS